MLPYFYKRDMPILGTVTLPTPSLSAIRSGNDNVLQWSVSNRKVNIFRVEKKVDAGAWGTLTTRSGGVLSDTYTDAGVTVDGTYSYRVVSVRGNREATSNEASVTVGNPNDAVLLLPENLTWDGAFRFPTTSGDQSYSYMSHGLAFNAANGSLFSIAHDWYQKIGEISIPTPVQSVSYSSLPIATSLQLPTDYFARVANMPVDQGAIKNGGLLVYNGKLYTTIYEFYDANYSAVNSHVRFDSLTLSSSVSPMMPTTANAGFTAGYMGHIPAAWQASIGAPCFTGQCGLSIVTRTSYGPALFGFDPEALNTSTAAVATTLLSYPSTHPLEILTSTNPTYNFLSRPVGVVFPEGADCVLLFGTHGTGEVWYGSNGDYPDKSDPCITSKGYHGYPYVTQMWAYNAYDLLDVKNGVKQSWEIRPYFAGPISVPIQNCSGAVCGAAYNPATQKLWLSMYAAGTNGASVCHQYSINLAV